MEYRKLLADGKQQKRSSELALELPVEPGRPVRIEVARGDVEAAFTDRASE